VHGLNSTAIRNKASMRSAPPDPGSVDRYPLDSVSRRTFLFGVVGLSLARSLFRIGVAGKQEPPITLPSAPFSRAFNFANLNSWITPTSEFFVRSHFGVPSAEVARWAVSVTGDVERERAFPVENLLRLPRLEATVTLECAGNPVGWGGVSNAKWTGVRLSALLESAGVKSGAKEVALLGADGGPEREAGGVHVDAYGRSIPLSKAMDGETMLAYRMNDEPLPDIHGGPLRVIVPGYYGMDSVKWVKQIVVTTQPFRGWHQLNRYYEERRVGRSIERRPLGAMRVKSQIARPLRNEVLNRGSVSIVGAAWCGDADISRVELSFDGGKSWKETTLGPQHDSRAWRLWSFQWLATAGRYEIIARATDSLGRAQPLEREPTVLTPYANSWCDRRTVVIK
jgi:DMSO/TMAO reductase YedYZ molybdopterin-dependent catalytic subunit